MDKTRANITSTSSIIAREMFLKVLKSNAGSFSNHFFKAICQGLQTPLLASLVTTIDRKRKKSSSLGGYYEALVKF